MHFHLRNLHFLTKAGHFCSTCCGGCTCPTDRYRMTFLDDIKIVTDSLQTCGEGKEFTWLKDSFYEFEYKIVNGLIQTVVTGVSAGRIMETDLGVDSTGMRWWAECGVWAEPGTCLFFPGVAIVNYRYAEDGTNVTDPVGQTLRAAWMQPLTTGSLVLAGDYPIFLTTSGCFADRLEGNVRITEVTQ